jgi:hypothetical protein
MPFAVATTQVYCRINEAPWRLAEMQGVAVHGWFDLREQRRYLKDLVIRSRHCCVSVYVLNELKGVDTFFCILIRRFGARALYKVNPFLAIVQIRTNVDDFVIRVKSVTETKNVRHVSAL